MELSKEQKANAAAQNAQAKRIKPEPTVVDWDKAFVRFYEILDEVYHPTAKKTTRKKTAKKKVAARTHKREGAE